MSGLREQVQRTDEFSFYNSSMTEGEKDEYSSGTGKGVTMMWQSEKKV